MRGRGQGKRAPSAREVAASLAGWPWLLVGSLASIACLPLAAAAAAETDATEQSRPVQVLDEERVTASALPTTAAAATQHVTVLRRAELDAMRGQSLSEILSRQAGVVIDRGPRSGGYGALYLRGADPSHVVVLIDHVRQNDPLSSRGSAVDLNTLSTDDIERIEIVRGNASVANVEAMAGLIHIFTRRATAGAGAGASIGGDGLRGGQAAWSGDGWRIGATQREDGDGSEGFHRSRAANAGWEHDFGQIATLRAALRASDSENRGFADDSGGARYAALRTLDVRRSDTRQLSLRGEFRPAAGVFEVQLATLSRDGDEATPGVAPGLRDPFGLPALTARTDYRRDELHAAWRMPLGEAWLLAVGVQQQRERGRFDSLIDFGFFALPADFELRRRTDSAFAELRWHRGDWTVQGGLRHERTRDDGLSRDDGSATHPMLSLQHALGEGRGQWGVSLARSSKAPSFYALGHPLVGNPGLRSESALHRELYYANDAASAWPTRITLFSARYRDLVDFDAGPPPQLVNRARIEADGVEWRGGHRFGHDWRLQLDGTWMRVRDPQGGVELRHRPRVQFGAQLAVPIGERRELSLMLRHLGRRFDSSIPTGDRWLRATTTLDLGLRQQWGPAQLLLAVDNLADARGEEVIGIDTPGRRVRLSLQWATP
jgi:outer membrane cobalamin receptor